MSTLTSYKQLQVVTPDPSGAGGLALNDNFMGLADCIGPCNYTATADPTTSDNQSTGYYTGSRWFNTSTNDEFVCISSTMSTAVWEKTTGGNSTPTLQDVTDAGNTTTDDISLANVFLASGDTLSVDNIVNAGGGTVTIGSTLSVGGNAIIDGGGNGTFTSIAVNTGSASMSIYSGGLQAYGNASALSLTGFSVDTTGNVTLGSGNTLSVDIITDAGSGTVTIGEGGQIYASSGTTTLNNFTLVANLTAQNQATFDGGLWGSGFSIDTSGNATFSDVTIVSGGTLSVDMVNDAGSGSITIGTATVVAGNLWSIDSSGNGTFANITTNDNASGPGWNMSWGGSLSLAAGSASIDGSGNGIFANVTITSGTLSIDTVVDAGSGTITVNQEMAFNNGLFIVPNTNTLISNGIFINPLNGFTENPDATIALIPTGPPDQQGLSMIMGFGDQFTIVASTESGDPYPYTAGVQNLFTVTSQTVSLLNLTLPSGQLTYDYSDGNFGSAVETYLNSNSQSFSIDGGGNGTFSSLVANGVNVDFQDLIDAAYGEGYSWLFDSNWSSNVESFIGAYDWQFDSNWTNSVGSYISAYSWNSDDNWTTDLLNQLNSWEVVYSDEPTSQIFGNNWLIDTSGIGTFASGVFTSGGIAVDSINGYSGTTITLSNCTVVDIDGLVGNGSLNLDATSQSVVIASTTSLGGNNWNIDASGDGTFANVISNSTLSFGASGVATMPIIDSTVTAGAIQSQWGFDTNTLHSYVFDGTNWKQLDN